MTNIKKKEIFQVKSKVEKDKRCLDSRELRGSESCRLPEVIAVLRKHARTNAEVDCKQAEVNNELRGHLALFR